MTQSIQKDALLAQFAQLAYKSDDYLSNSSNLPGGWTKVAGEVKNGFAAFAFRNDTTGEVVVAFRGTDGLNDAGVDTAIATGSWHPQFDQAVDFMARLKQNAGAYPDGFEPTKTAVTGHSLGGAEAQIVSQAYGLDGAAMDPGAAGRIVQTDGFRAATDRAGLPAGGEGMPATFKNWLVAGSMVSDGTGPQLGKPSYLPSLSFSGEQALTAFVIGLMNPAAGIGYAVAVDQFSNKHASAQISDAMNLLAGVGGNDSAPSTLTLNPKIIGWHTDAESGQRLPQYSQAEFEVRDASGAVQSELKFSGSGSDRKLEILAPSGELKSTISLTEGGSVVQVNPVRQPSIEVRVLPETSYNADGSVTAITRGTNGQVLSTAVTRIADDGSNLTVTEYANGTTRYVSFDSDQQKYRIVEERTVGNQTISRLLDSKGETLISQTVTETQSDGSKVITESNADGSYRVTKLDDAGNITDTREVGPVAAAMERQTPILQDMTSLINAIRSGDDILIGGSGIKLINDVAHLSGANVPYLSASNAVLQGAVSLYNLDKAFQQDNDLVKLQATLGAVNAINSAYQAVYREVTGQAVQQGVSTAVGQTVGKALPWIGVVYDLKEGNYAGAAVGMAGIYSVPYVGWIYAAYMLISALSNTPPEAWGTAVYKFGDGTEVTLDVVGEAFGPGKVRLLMEGSGTPGEEGYFPGLLGYLNQRIESLESADPDQQLGIIPQRLPRVTWREARQGDPGYAIVDIDPLTGEQRNAFLRYNDDFSPYNADPTDPVQRQNVFERMIASALERGAIAPMWEVQTARLQQDAHDPNAGLTEEERAAKRGELAPIDPTKPNERVGTFRPVVLDLDGDNTITTVANDPWFCAKVAA